MKKQTVALIAAVGRDGVIGDSRGRFGLPWHIPEDLRHFKNLTLGHPIIMGRTTHELIGRVLPGRQNIVLTRSLTTPLAEGVFRASSLAAAFAKAGDGLVFVIGGASVYEEALGVADLLFLTEVDRDVDGDARFPEWSPDQFHLRDSRPADSESDVRFRTYERKQEPFVTG